MIREERDPAFWLEIASHPALAGALMGLDPVQVAEVCQRPNILPLASENGGFFFGRMDGLGAVLELHTLYRPKGWGREVATAGKAALALVFSQAQAVMTFELRDNRRSQPPRSFGFEQAADWESSAIGEARVWVLTRRAWEASPAGRRAKPCQ